MMSLIQSNGKSLINLVTKDYNEMMIGVKNMIKHEKSDKKNVQYLIYMMWIRLSLCLDVKN